MASLTRRRRPSAKPSWPCSVRSCRTLFKSSGSVWWPMWFWMLDVFADTPTGNHCGPPSTSFARAEQLHPFGVRLRSARYARLRSASPQRGEAGGKKDNLQMHVSTATEKRPKLTEEQKQRLYRAHGFDPEQYDIDEERSE